MKLYLGGPMFSEADVLYNIALANQLRDSGFIVYCPNENKSINDKTSQCITGEKIYTEDIRELETCNVFICQIAEDSGTMWEAGYMDCLSKRVDRDKYLGSIGLTTDIRLQTLPNPRQSGVDNQSMYLNQFIVGGLKLSLGICRSREELVEKLQHIKKERLP